MDLSNINQRKQWREGKFLDLRDILPEDVNSMAFSFSFVFFSSILFVFWKNVDAFPFQNVDNI